MPRRAFTLVELLVVIAIIGLLSTVAVVSLNSSKANARNTKRKADFVQISKALELYYADNGSYPSTGGHNWAVTDVGCCDFVQKNADSGADAWIPNLAPTYMAKLPRDVNTNKLNPSSPRVDCNIYPNYNTYFYRSDGVDYKVFANCTPEGVLSASDPFVDSLGVALQRYSLSTPGAAGWN